MNELLVLKQTELALKIASNYFTTAFRHHLKTRPINSIVGDACAKMGKVYEEQHKPVEAIYWRKKHVILLSSKTDSAELGLALMHIAIQYSGRGKDRVALEYMQRAYRVRMAVFGVDHSLTVDVKSWVDELESDLDEDEEEEVDDVDATVDSELELAVKQQCEGNRSRASLMALPIDCRRSMTGHIRVSSIGSTESIDMATMGGLRTTLPICVCQAEGMNCEAGAGVIVELKAGVSSVRSHPINKNMQPNEVLHLPGETKMFDVFVYFQGARHAQALDIEVAALVKQGEGKPVWFETKTKAGEAFGKLSLAYGSPKIF